MPAEALPSLGMPLVRLGILGNFGRPEADGTSIACWIAAGQAHAPPRPSVGLADWRNGLALRGNPTLSDPCQIATEFDKGE